MIIGVYGGCFNPPHSVHVSIIRDILREGIVDKLFVVPAGNCYGKKGLVDIKHRINMLKLSLEGIDRVSVESIEEGDNPIHTYMLLDHFREEYPDATIKFIMGSDNLKEISTWTNPEYLLRTFRFIVVLREDDSIDTLEKFDTYKTCEYIESKGCISSTQVRYNISHNFPFSAGQIDDKVLEYISKNKLYEDKNE